MKFIEVKELPKRIFCKPKYPYERMGKKNLKDYLKEFINMDVKYAKVEFNENDYKTHISAHAALFNAALRHCLPVEVRIINKEVYLIRKDI